MYIHRSLMKRGAIAPHKNLASSVCHHHMHATWAQLPSHRHSTPGADQNVHGTDEQPACCLIL